GYWFATNPENRQRRHSLAVVPAEDADGFSRSREIKAVSVHHFGPRRHEVLHELLLGVRTRIDFGEGAKLRVRTEDQVDAGAGPLDRLRLPVAALVNAVAGWLPLRAHVEEVDEKVVRQLLLLLGEDTMFGTADIGAEHAQATDEHRHLRRRQPQQLCPVHQRLFRRHKLELFAVGIVAEAVGTRL